MSKKLKKVKVNKITNLVNVGKEITLEDFAKAIGGGNEQVKNEVLGVRNEQNPDIQNKKKLRLAGIVPTGLLVKGKNKTNASILNHNGIFMLDVDYLENEEQVKMIKKKASEIPSTIMAFISPRGNGVKILVNANFKGQVDKNGNKELNKKHQEAFLKVNSYYEKELGVKLDDKVKTLSNNHFISYDPELYVNWGASEFNIYEENEKEKVQVEKGYYCELREKYICPEDIEMAKLDAVEMQGREKELEKLALELEELMHENESKSECVEEVMPYIPDEVYDLLPFEIKNVCKNFTNKRERDIILMSILPVLGAALSDAHFIDVFKKASLNLYTFIIAPASSGKGKMELVRIVADKIADKKKELLNKGLNPDDYKNVDFVIAGNISDTAIVKKLQENYGQGVIIESEADSLTKSLSQDWGDFSDVLRKNYHQEPIKVSRVKNDLDIYIKSPKLSIAISGTPDQVGGLVKSIENGLFSRLSFYSFSPKGKVYRTKAERRGGSNITLIESSFNTLGDLACELMEVLSENPVECDMIVESKFEEYWVAKGEELGNIYGDQARAIVSRGAIQCEKIMWILSLIRKAEEIKNKKPNSIYNSTDDLKAAILITETILNHNLSVFQKANQKGLTPIEEVLLEMPNEFSGVEFKKKGEERLRVTPRMIETHLKSLIASGKVKKIKRNLYQKVSNKKK